MSIALKRNGAVGNALVRGLTVNDDDRLPLLGSAIRGFRERARPQRISQFRLSSLMNWEGTAPVIEIEKGRRRPRPETLNALGEALGLDPADVAYLHGLAGYRNLTVLPSPEQIRRRLDPLRHEIAKRMFPVQVLDYQFNHWMVNAATAVMLGIPASALELLMKNQVHGFNAVFDSRLPVRKCFVRPEVAERERVYRFKAHNLYRRHEPFYVAYPECLKDQMLEADYARFVRTWNEVDLEPPEAFPVHPQVEIVVAGRPIVFAIHMVELLHLDRLVYVAYYEPVGAEAAVLEVFENGPRGCLCRWD
jgi:hypothetical protein